MNSFELPQILWCAAIVVFLCVELLTPSALVSIWFVAGSLAALIVSLFCDAVAAQVAVFVAVTALTLIFTRPLVVRRTRTAHVATNADQVIGMTGRVTVAVQPPEGGRVQVNGLSWAARCDTPLEPGEWCTVFSIEGATLIVRPAQNVEKQIENKQEKQKEETTV